MTFQTPESVAFALDRVANFRFDNGHTVSEVVLDHRGHSYRFEQIVYEEQGVRKVKIRIHSDATGVSYDGGDAQLTTDDGRAPTVPSLQDQREYLLRELLSMIDRNPPTPRRRTFTNVGPLFNTPVSVPVRAVEVFKERQDAGRLDGVIPSPV